MKIWNEFGSSHSDNISIVGTFKDASDANKAKGLIEDLVFGSWEERYPSIEDFYENWEGDFSWVKYLITADDYETGVDNDPGFEVIDDKIVITRFRDVKVGGIIKAMLYLGVVDTKIERK